MGGLGAYVRALRPHQWVKNALLFLPMLTAHTFSWHNIALLCWAVAAFCLTASATYIVNDMIDLEADRHHRSKRNRPLAKAEITLAGARILALALIVAGAGLASIVSLPFLAALGVYVAGTLGYSLALKRRPVVDVLILAGLYTLRVVAGGVALRIPISAWLLAFCLFLFLCLAFVKRLTELQSLPAGADATRMGRGYRQDDIPLLLILCAVSGYVSVLVLALYVNSPVVATLYSHPEGLWGVCLLLLYWITRTLLLTHRGEIHDDPVLFVLKDGTSLGILGLTALIIGACAL
ncbi:UbiA family prenyltransferase [Telmatospirillum sp.]|uniref:UbiA family prenyltransferase n=1 Tax=Telmatospirillum sp. TaxID=2079197 RepID=UPI002841A3C2|nr:UbiA family prenyltransferase [Telmatospirillum sp.]MDR3435508.1 UbiA family prenyltransferase [Telmatospirillum sp.]